MQQIWIEPSLLSADLGHLSDEVKRIEEAGADAIHIDIMDGHFVPNLTFGPRIVAAVNRATSLFLDIHLMIYNPYQYIETFIQAGADRITFHFEATEDVEDTLQFIHKCGKQAGLAFCPETSFSMIPHFLPLCDLILLMTVHPGFGGQAFMPEVLEKITLTREYCNQYAIKPKEMFGAPQGGQAFNIKVDGGINQETAKQCIEAGANILVSGNYLLGQPNLKEAVVKMRELG